jgi:hypothetical protein
MRTKDLALLVNDYNSDRPTRASVKFMNMAKIPAEVEEEDDDENGYVRCRPFVVSRRQLKGVVKRYVRKAFFGKDSKVADAALLSYAMLPKSVSMSEFKDNPAVKGLNEDDTEILGVQRPEIGSETEVVGRENPMSALVAMLLKLAHPERLRLHIRAKPKIGLCRNTIVLI